MKQLRKSTNSSRTLSLNTTSEIYIRQTWRWFNAFSRHRRSRICVALILFGCLIWVCGAFATEQVEEDHPNASWMEDKLHGYRCQTLTTFTLPASHDSAMYEINKLEINGDSLSTWINRLFDTVLYVHKEVLEFFDLYDDVVEVLTDYFTDIGGNFARTQDLSIGEQLNYGIRYFNLRPKWYGGYDFVLHHSEEGLDLGVNIDLKVWEHFIGFENVDMSMNGPELSTVLSDIQNYLATGHQELIILKVDHYWTKGGYAFNDAAYTNLQLMIQDYLGPWLVTTNQIPEGQSLAETTFSKLIGNKGRVLLLCEDDDSWAFTDPSIGIWSSSDLGAGGKYKNTTSQGDMETDQRTRFETNNVPRFKLMWTLTVPSGVEAISYSVRGLADEINPDLWDFVDGLTIPNTNGNVLNEIWVDFVEDTGVTDLAIELNNQCPDCVIVAPSVVGGGIMGVTLDGSGSSDPDGDALTYEWRQVGGPLTVTMYNTNSAVAAFDAPITGCGCIFEFMLTVTDERGASCWDTVEIQVIDVTPPVLYCDAPAQIAPCDTPVTYTASATDNCDTNPVVEITDYRCFKFTGNGKRIDMTHSAHVQINGPTIILPKTGGVGTHHEWKIRATDDSGNVSIGECPVEIVIPGQNE